MSRRKSARTPPYHVRETANPDLGFRLRRRSEGGGWILVDMVTLADSGPVHRSREALLRSITALALPTSDRHEDLPLPSGAFIRLRAGRVGWYAELRGKDGKYAAPIHTRSGANREEAEADAKAFVEKVRSQG